MIGADRVLTDIDLAEPDAIALVVIGEDPYAEMLGDIGKTKTLEYQSLNGLPADLELIRELKQRATVS